MNERIRTIAAGFAVVGDSYDIFCECGRLGCVERLAVPSEIYERVRGDTHIYLVRSGHETSSDGHVLNSTGAYSVVFSS